MRAGASFTSARAKARWPLGSLGNCRTGVSSPKATSSDALETSMPTTEDGSIMPGPSLRCERAPKGRGSCDCSGTHENSRLGSGCAPVVKTEAGQDHAAGLRPPPRLTPWGRSARAVPYRKEHTRRDACATHLTVHRRDACVTHRLR